MYNLRNAYFYPGSMLGMKIDDDKGNVYECQEDGGVYRVEFFDVDIVM